MSNQDILLNPNFHFHLVDALGTATEQASGGFWSLGFVLKNDEVVGQSTSAATTAVQTPSSSVYQSTFSTNGHLTTALVTASPTPSAAGGTSLNSVSASATASGAASGSSSGLSSGAIAGIVVGVIVPIAIAVALGALWLWWQRKKIVYQAQAQAAAQEQHTSYLGGTSPYNGDSTHAKEGVGWNGPGYAAVSQQAPAELAAHSRPMEMDANNPVEAGVPVTAYPS
jgi:hypothetical protein